MRLILPALFFLAVILIFVFCICVGTAIKRRGQEVVSMQWRVFTDMSNIGDYTIVGVRKVAKLRNGKVLDLKRREVTTVHHSECFKLDAAREEAYLLSVKLNASDEVDNL